MMNIWKSLLGKEQQGEEARENMPALIVCAGLGGYMTGRVSQVLVIILLRRSWSSTTDLSTVITAVHRRHSQAQCSTNPEANWGQTGALHLMLLPPYLFFITMIIFLHCFYSHDVIHSSRLIWDWMMVVFHWYLYGRLGKLVSMAWYRLVVRVPVQ